MSTITGVLLGFTSFYVLGIFISLQFGILFPVYYLAYAGSFIGGLIGLSKDTGGFGSATAKPLDPNSVSANSDQAKCPYCAELVQREALICKHCKSNLSRADISVSDESANGKES